MGVLKQIGGAATVGAAMVIGCGLSAPPAQAAYVVTLTQVGSNVVATGSGTIDLAGLGSSGSSSAGSALTPNIGGIITGPPGLEPIASYTGFTGPASFGSGGGTRPSSGSGDTVGVIIDAINQLLVPAGYVSGNPLSDTSTYDSQTFSSLGVTPGTYVWNWSSGPTADSFTLNVATAAVPEPASLLLLALPLGLVLLLACGPAARLRRKSDALC